MTVTQYVGARYVPLFANPIDWDKDSEYEPLTIVIHEGNSYTSRQAVPKGIDIANDEFWALTSNYNAQVESYRKETAKAVEDASNALSLAQTNEQDIATLDSEMAGTADSGLKSLIEEKKTRSIYVYEPSVPNGITNTANIIVTDKVGLIDCGNNMTDAVVSAMNELGYTSFDYVVFSHMHTDHTAEEISNIAKLKPFISENTPIYIQMAPLSTFPEYSTYEKGLAAVNSLGGSVSVPTDLSTIKIGETEITFYNSDSSNISAYNEVGNLNVFSLVTKIKYGENTYVNCGDVWWTAQYIYRNVIGNCDLVLYPHHGLNTWDVFEFIDQFAANAAYATPRPEGTTWHEDANPLSFWNRYYRDNPSVKLYATNKKGLGALKITNGNVTQLKNFVKFGANLYSTSYSTFAYLDADANLTDDIDAYKNWSLFEFQTKFSHIPNGTKIQITQKDAQFYYQLYAIAKCMVYDYQSDLVPIAEKTTAGTVPIFLYQLTDSPLKIAIRTDSKYTMPTFDSLDSVKSKYTFNESTKIKSFCGECYDISSSASYLPRLANNIGGYVSTPASPYYVGGMSWSDFKTNWSAFRIKSTFNMCDRYLTYYVADNSFDTNFRTGWKTAHFAPEDGNQTDTWVENGHVWQIMANDNQVVIFDNGNQVFSTDDDSNGKKIKFVTYIGRTAAV